MMIEKEALIVGLYDLGAVQFGEFRLKSGEKSPVYLDLRLLVSRPGLLRRVARAMRGYAETLRFDRLTAIPMSGLPIGVALSLEMDCPLIYPRSDVKQHGTGRYIEGLYRPGETLLLIDDVISLGDSKLEAIRLLEALRLKVTDMLVVVDRNMGGALELARQGYRVHALLSLQEILDRLLDLRRISLEQHSLVNTWLAEKKSGI
ncbi:MAG: orotate phosphoribosyltransferase [Anaerolineae bacterium]